MVLYRNDLKKQQKLMFNLFPRRCVKQCFSEKNNNNMNVKKNSPKHTVTGLLTQYTYISLIPQILLHY